MKSVYIKTSTLELFKEYFTFIFLMMGGASFLFLFSCGVQEGQLLSSNNAGALYVHEKNGVVADLYIDGFPVQKSTPVALSHIPEGKHIVSLIKDGYQISNDTLNIQAGITHDLEVELKTENTPHTLTITSTYKNAEVWIDGIQRGFAPQNIAFKSGLAHIELRAGTATAESTLNVYSNQTLLLDPTPKSWVLLEHFSNTACIPCPSVDHGLEKYFEEHPENRRIHIAMHINSPSPEDIFFTPYEHDLLERFGGKYYALSSVPRVQINGRKAGAKQDSASLVQFLIDSLNTELSITPSAHVQILNLKNSDTHATGTIQIKALQNISGMRLKVALSEDQIHMESAPGINGLKDFIDMFRGFAQISSELQTLNSGESQEIQFDTPLPSAHKAYSLVVFIENPTEKKVYQSFKQKVPYTY